MGNTAGKDGEDAVVDYARLQTDLINNQNFKNQVNTNLIGDSVFRGHIIDEMKKNDVFRGPMGFTTFSSLSDAEKTNLIGRLVQEYKSTFGQQIINSTELKAWLLDPLNSTTFRGPAGPDGKGYDSDESKNYLKERTLWCADGTCQLKMNSSEIKIDDAQFTMNKKLMVNGRDILAELDTVKSGIEGLKTRIEQVSEGDVQFRGNYNGTPSWYRPFSDGSTSNGLGLGIYNSKGGQNWAGRGKFYSP
jgi:hypothetical protein